MKNFNQEELIKEVEELVQKVFEEQKIPNVLICGQTGAGKGSAINYIAREKIADVGDVEPITGGIKYYKTENINMYDSEGYEIGSNKQSHYNELIMNFLKEHKGTEEKDVHLIWYCISGAGKKYTELDKSLINKMKEDGFKVCVLITKIDEMTINQLNDLFDSIKKDYKDIDIFKLSIKESCIKISEWEKLIGWSINNLEEVFKARFLSGLKFQYGLQEKEKQAKKIINVLAASAGGVAVTPIPFSDAILLIPIQAGMCTKILSIYDIKVGNKTIISAINSGGITKVAKILIGTISKAIPVLGSGGGTVINTTVATSITKGLGELLLWFANRYTKDKIAGKEWTKQFEQHIDSVDFILKIKELKDLFNA